MFALPSTQKLYSYGWNKKVVKIKASWSTEQKNNFLSYYREAWNYRLACLFLGLFFFVRSTLTAKSIKCLLTFSEHEGLYLVRRWKMNCNRIDFLFFIGLLLSFILFWNNSTVPLWFGKWLYWFFGSLQVYKNLLSFIKTTPKNNSNLFSNSHKDSSSYALIYVPPYRRHETGIHLLCQ